YILILHPLPLSTLFPYTTLFRSWLNGFHHITTSNRPIRDADDFAGLKIRTPGGELAADFFRTLGAAPGMVPFSGMYQALKAKTLDRKSTRLNSSHVAISYAVFCL